MASMFSEQTSSADFGILSPGGEVLLTAIVSTFKAEALIRGCLDNLVRQSLFAKGGLEILVIDAASPENEVGIVREFQERHPNIRYVRTHERIGLYQAWNEAILLSTARYVTNANTDDAHRPDALELLVEALERDPRADVAYADCYWTWTLNDTWESGSERKEIRYPAWNPADALFWCTLGPHPVWRRTVFDRHGLFDPSFLAAGDYEYHVRLATAGGHGVHVPQTLSLFYQNQQGLTLANGVSDQEFRVTRERYRKQLSIDKIFPIVPGVRRSASKAWMALARLSMDYQVPWQESTNQDLRFARHCLRQARAVDPFHPAIPTTLCWVWWQGLAGRRLRNLANNLRAGGRRKEMA